MKSTFLILGTALVLIAGLVVYYASPNLTPMTSTLSPTAQLAPVRITPISHATMALSWGNTTIYTDPVGGAQAFAGQKPPSLILVTDIHGDHLSTSTLTDIIGSASLIVPQAVKNLLPPALANRARALENGRDLTEQNLKITAVPMYNLPESPDSYHTKGRGNGYLLERDGFRVYIAGDTAGTPEMRALQNIDIAFIPMNLPYTMSVDEAADAVAAFKPRQVYPYHYRGPDGLADVNRFKQLVNQKDPSINVILADWYPTIMEPIR